MKIEFRNDIITHVPTAMLIEDIQVLIQALRAEDLEAAWSVVECLNEAIDTYTEVPKDLHIKPSATSVLAGWAQKGIIVSEGMDLKCAMGLPVSHAMEGGCGQCADDCPCMKQGKCSLASGQVMLHGGFVYDGTFINSEGVVAFLENCPENNSCIFCGCEWFSANQAVVAKMVCDESGQIHGYSTEPVQVLDKPCGPYTCEVCSARYSSLTGDMEQNLIAGPIFNDGKSKHIRAIRTSQGDYIPYDLSKKKPITNAASVTKDELSRCILAGVRPTEWDIFN